MKAQREQIFSEFLQLGVKGRDVRTVYPADIYIRLPILKAL